MAYAAAAVSSVMQSLECMLYISRMILRIRKFEMEIFTEKSRVIARLSEEFSSSIDQSHQTLPLAAQVVATIHSTIRELVGDPTRVDILKTIVKKLAFDISRSTPRMVEMISEQSEGAEDVLEEVPKTLEEMDLVETELKNSYVKMPEMLKDNCRKMVGNPEDMFSAISKLRTDTTFFHKGAMKIKGLLQDLSFLMAFLRDTTNLYKNQDVVKDLEKYISIMASRAEDFVQEKLLDISLQSKLNSLILTASKEEYLDEQNMLYFINEKFPTVGSSMIRRSQFGVEFPLRSIIRTALNEIFHEENGILPALLSKFQEIESLKEKVNTMYDQTPEVENSQSPCISTKISRPYLVKDDTAASVSSLVITDPEKYLEKLALSYYHLPHHLKACFLYVGAFPEGWEIEVQKLINLWIAEDLLDLNSSKRLEEIGEDCLNDLVNRGLVLVGKMSSSGKIKTCRIHDLLREFCLREAQKEKFMHVIKRSSHGFPSDLNDKHLLSFHSEFHGDVYLLPSLPLVRSFLCFSSGCFFSPDIFFLHLRFKLLRVLDISFLHFDYFPAQILELVLLRYLELTVAYELPSELSLPGNLCTLVIHGSWNTKQSTILSLAYWNMPRLRHLHISVTSILQLPKRQLRYPLGPTSLQTLSTIGFSSCRRQVFEVMPHLKKLGICETKDGYHSRSSQFLGNLVYLEQLEILKCSFYMENNRMNRDNLISDISFPLSIRQLTLRWSFLPWEDMTSIARLPNLEVLKLKNYAFQGREWTPTEDGFCRLKHLLIDETDLEDWKASSIHFPMLQRLVLRSCNFLKEIPFSVVGIPTLEVIQLHYCSKSAEVSAEEIRSQIDGVEVHIQSS